MRFYKSTILLSSFLSGGDKGGFLIDNVSALSYSISMKYSLQKGAHAIYHFSFTTLPALNIDV